MGAIPPVQPAVPSAEIDFQNAAAEFIAEARNARDPVAEASYLYNAATCWLSAAEQVDQAVERLRQAAKDASDAAVNDGSMSDDDDDMPDADTTSMLEQSIQLYETALQRIPKFPAAARNLEIARARWREAVTAQEKAQQSADAKENQPPDSKKKGDPQSAEDGNDPDDPDNDDPNADPTKPGDAASQRSDTSLADLLNQNIPPPNVSPQDILRRELENNQQRSAPTDPKMKPVEKNW